MAIDKNQGILKTLHNCAAACHYCASSCLDEPTVQHLTTCIKIDLDCADICTTTAAFVARISPHAPHLMKECTEICLACARECDKHAAMGMEHCRLCAEACRQCAEACSLYIGSAA
ncbi:four-helix bundle copper-binding protein [Flavihumibacter solisilvae]|uniref:Ferredoxin n=1 Tax=Flavihumibacter solisilvae TaxID=1349421 RepID=A0A0C1IXC0_9BACT|nr:four-helix bundle copper-binding protein [Flavihumibacter solisilvae]KIC95089.1 ferredoxin [Flavihumibacter solisilvae]